MIEPHFVVDTRHHGTGPIVFAWHSKGSFVATTGSSRVVHIFSSNGQVLDQVVLPSASNCTALAWNHTGDVLAIIQASSSLLTLWDSHTQKVNHVETSIKELTFLEWSPATSVNKPHLLAIGTGRGILIIYNHSTGQRYQTATSTSSSSYQHHLFAPPPSSSLPSHSSSSSSKKRVIICGGWSLDGKYLAYGSEDKQLMICMALDGQVVDQVKLKSRPIDLSFGGFSSNSNASTGTTKGRVAEGTGMKNMLSVNLEGKALLLYNIQERDNNALVLAFQSRYGTLLTYKWFGDGYIMAGFGSGYVVVISTYQHEIGREQICVRFHQEDLRDIAYCPFSHRLATCGDGGIKLIDMQSWKVMQHQKLDHPSHPHGLLDHLAWAGDGRYLSVSTKSGNLFTYAFKDPERMGEAKRVISPSTIAVVMKPVSPLGLSLSLLVVSCLLAFTVASTSGVLLLEVVRALLGQNESI